MSGPWAGLHLSQPLIRQASANIPAALSASAVGIEHNPILIPPRNGTTYNPLAAAACAIG
ncbi:MAG: hypothetical protein VYC11_00455 [Candidatus Thermoplasmatota archaeon]|nr:hypothetical protein [Candidatus Thermoplasmatota archaeon]